MNHHVPDLLARVVLALGVVLLTGASLGCDCLRSYRIGGVVTATSGVVEGRACFDDDCEPWGELAAASDAGTELVARPYSMVGGGNGSRCEYPTRYEFRAPGCETVSLPVSYSDSSRKLVQDVTLTCR